MTTETWVTVVGSLGGVCTTFAFVPQVLKIWKQGGRDLSYGMLALYLIGAILWLTYGILLRARASNHCELCHRHRHRHCNGVESVDGAARCI